MPRAGCRFGAVVERQHLTAVHTPVLFRTRVALSSEPPTGPGLRLSTRTEFSTTAETATEAVGVGLLNAMEGPGEGLETPPHLRGGMDTDRLMELAPHYIAMFVCVFVVLTVVQAAVGEVGFWVEMGIIVVVVFAYRPAVLRLGIAPSGWE
jgi:hypothetical protein